MKNIFKFALILCISITVFILFLFAILFGATVHKITGHSCWFENSIIENHAISFSANPHGTTIGTVYRYNDDETLGGYTINLLKNKTFYGVLNEESILKSARTPELFRQNINEYCKDTNKTLTCLFKKENQTQIEWIRWFFGKVTYFDITTSKIACNSSEIDQLLTNNLNSSEAIICILDDVELQCEDYQDYSPV